MAFRFLRFQPQVRILEDRITPSAQSLLDNIIIEDEAAVRDPRPPTLIDAPTNQSTTSTRSIAGQTSPCWSTQRIWSRRTRTSFLRISECGRTVPQRFSPMPRMIRSRPTTVCSCIWHCGVPGFRRNCTSTGLAATGSGFGPATSPARCGRRDAASG